MPIFAKIKPMSLDVDPGVLAIIAIGGVIVWLIMTFAVSEKKRKRIIVIFRSITTGTDLSDHYAAGQLLDESNEEKAYRKMKSRQHFQNVFGRFFTGLKRTAGILRDCLWMVILSLAIIITTYLLTAYNQ